MTKTSPHSPLLVPGRNCWRQERAGRIAFLVDGDAYFRAVRAAAARARHSIFILGWDIDSRMELVPEGADDGLPEPLGDFLDALTRQTRQLHVYVLNWDFAMLYAPDREFLPGYKLGLRTHRRFRFELDGAHPVGSSHHQKVVVIDDALAFVGGLDLTSCRWDTPEHRPDDPRRRDASGDACTPFHDIQAAVDGAAAAALGELARERWRRATGKKLSASESAQRSDPWPDSLPVDLADADVAIARTEPEYDDYSGVMEIKCLLLDMIGAAEQRVYLENQYFSASSIAEALATRLAEPAGPEVVMVSREREEGWLEDSTMGVLRARSHQRLLEADAHQRYGFFYPRVPGLGDSYVNVHSKVLIVDDELLTIGSANMNNRSMGFDTECNLAIEARGEERVRDAIRALRHRLLGEHLGTSAEKIAACEQQAGSTLAAIKELNTGERTLEPLEPEISEELEEWVPDEEFIDPEQPIEPERLAAKLMSRETRASTTGRALVGAGLLALLVGLAAAWQWTDLGEWLAPERLGSIGEAIKGLPGAPLLILGAYLVGSLLMVPITLMIAATTLVFGPWLALAYAFGGSLFAALVTFGLGQFFGRATVRRLAGSRLDRLSRELGRRGFLSILTVRVVPVAPFTVINLVAGATHISLRDFVLGTVVGLAPGIIGMVLFIDRAVAAIRDPSPWAFVVLGGVLALIVAGVLVLRRWLRGRAADGKAG